MNYHDAYHDNSNDQREAKRAAQYSQDLSRQCGFRNCEGADYLDWEMQDIIGGDGHARPAQLAAKQLFADSTSLISRIFARGGIYDADHECCPLKYRGINNHENPLRACKTKAELQEYMRELDLAHEARKVVTKRNHAAYLIDLAVRGEL